MSFKNTIELFLKFMGITMIYTLASTMLFRDLSSYESFFINREISHNSTIINIFLIVLVYFLLINKASFFANNIIKEDNPFLIEKKEFIALVFTILIPIALYALITQTRYDIEYNPRENISTDALFYILQFLFVLPVLFYFIKNTTLKNYNYLNLFIVFSYLFEYYNFTNKYYGIIPSSPSFNCIIYAAWIVLFLSSVYLFYRFVKKQETEMHFNEFLMILFSTFILFNAFHKLVWYILEIASSTEQFSLAHLDYESLKIIFIELILAIVLFYKFRTIGQVIKSINAPRFIYFLIVFLIVDFGVVVYFKNKNIILSIVLFFLVSFPLIYFSKTIFKALKLREKDTKLMQNEVSDDEKKPYYFLTVTILVLLYFLYNSASIFMIMNSMGAFIVIIKTVFIYGLESLFIYKMASIFYKKSNTIPMLSISIVILFTLLLSHFFIFKFNPIFGNNELVNQWDIMQNQKYVLLFEFLIYVLFIIFSIPISRILLGLGNKK